MEHFLCGDFVVKDLNNAKESKRLMGQQLSGESMQPLLKAMGIDKFGVRLGNQNHVWRKFVCYMLFGAPLQALGILPILVGEHICKIEPGIELIATLFSEVKDLHDKGSTGGWLGGLPRALCPLALNAHGGKPASIFVFAWQGSRA